MTAVYDTAFYFLADLTNVRAYATMLRRMCPSVCLSSVTYVINGDSL